MDFRPQTKINQATPQPQYIQPQASQPPRLNLRVVRRWWKIAAVVLTLIGVSLLSYGYVHTRTELEKISNPKTAGQTESQKLVNQIGTLVDLPSGETPTVATVKDAIKLKSQDFFAHAQNGDRVVVYSQAHRAVLYRPSTNKVIEYSKVFLNGVQ
jgi:hypothetical protein